MHRTHTAQIACANSAKIARRPHLFDEIYFTLLERARGLHMWNLAQEYFACVHVRIRACSMEQHVGEKNRRNKEEREVIQERMLFVAHGLYDV